MRILLTIALLVLFEAVFAGILVAAASDEEADELYQDYLRYKQEKEKKNDERNT